METTNSQAIEAGPTENKKTGVAKNQKNTGADAAGKRTVVIQKPYGVTDSHLFIGFNGFEAQVAYDTPVALPEAVIDHLKSIERVQYRADDGGKPVAHYTKTYSVVDA